MAYLDSRSQLHSHLQFVCVLHIMKLIMSSKLDARKREEDIMEVYPQTVRNEGLDLCYDFKKGNI